MKGLEIDGRGQSGVLFPAGIPATFDFMYIRGNVRNGMEYYKYMELIKQQKRFFVWVGEQLHLGI